MKKDIEFPTVEMVGVCAIPEDVDGEVNWKVHIINLLDKPIENVLVSTRGYGTHVKAEVKTSELRHFFEKIESKAEKQIEIITHELVGLNNQYWVSFYLDDKIFDKKYIFLPDSLVESNLTPIPVLESEGILII